MNCLGKNPGFRQFAPDRATLSYNYLRDWWPIDVNIPSNNQCLIAITPIKLIKTYLKPNKTESDSNMTTLAIGPIVLSVLALSSALWPVAGAQAQPMTVRAGEEHAVLMTFFEIDKRTCQALARPNLWMIEEPSVGRAHIGGTTELHTIGPCRPVNLPVAQVVYSAPLDAAGKITRLTYGANFQSLSRNHTRTIDIVIVP